MRIDLHTHSTASDGTDSPAELVRAARTEGLDVVALTDHDTTGGWAEAVAALPTGLTLLRGAELSCVSLSPTGSRVTLHLLAYLFDPTEAAFVAEQRRLRGSRLDRGRQIVERLAADGYPVDWDAVRELAGDGSVGRPHIARLLVRVGVVSSVGEAFERILHPSSPYYVAKQDTEVLTAVRMVRAAGGVPVFAHPLARHRGRVVSDEVIAEMAAAGLAGLEVDHPDQAPADRAQLRGLAAELGLVMTGSSDYHGVNKAVRLGAQRTDPAAYEAIVARASGLAPVVG
ncbi:MAG TPA: PHP domain-containing protein [Mycobacteriales bacterium]|nr:PHP domain-containing protein [Mycobacteriales bacterium]